jgi:hypothetical protein
MLIYGLTGMVVLPWMLTTATVPYLAEVYSLTPMPVLARIAGFGLCWGIGSALENEQWNQRTQRRAQPEDDRHAKTNPEKIHSQAGVLNNCTHLKATPTWLELRLCWRESHFARAQEC